jgi:hypothetical protein
MAKRAAKKTSDPVELQKLISRYEQVFGAVQHFIDLIGKQDEELVGLSEEMHHAEDEFKTAKSRVLSAREARDGTKHALFVYLRPGPAEILPLFDRMEPANDKEHGKGSGEWRQEPISALRLSLVATNLLTAADIIFVGQLQDRIQSDDEGDWWEQVESLTAPIAAAIADRLAEFIAEHTR